MLWLSPSLGEHPEAAFDHISFYNLVSTTILTLIHDDPSKLVSSLEPGSRQNNNDSNINKDHESPRK